MFFIEFTSKNTVLEAIFFKKSLHFYHFFAKISKKLTKINKILSNMHICTHIIDILVILYSFY